MATDPKVLDATRAPIAKPAPRKDVVEFSKPFPIAHDGLYVFPYKAGDIAQLTAEEADIVEREKAGVRTKKAPNIRVRGSQAERIVAEVPVDEDA